ncbi:formate dehydrogenase accessory sulfurtransferase FdhD [Alloyangia pacifica]|uniref:formate dehydrogenase accessory sulfurtransferase FdhD n=1 Tax=Alloyangia pacifica TaxID=311180 RepID=UPI001CFD0652|nr:formate dehydrogenase accessory sulfurtransferase FdhD [Alloyangia pacifica]
MRPTHTSRPSLRLTPGSPQSARRALIEETPVAMVFDGATQAVLMTSPSDLEDFALGFALSEGIITGPTDVREIEIVPHDAAAGGVEARIWLQQDRSVALTARRRSGLGPVGCGLCGIESLEAAMRPLPKVPFRALGLSADEVLTAPELLRKGQVLHAATRAAHAAGFYVPGHGMVCLREDVGRHNALDKLLGALLRQGIDPGRGAIVMTSRLSMELVQKTAIAGCGCLIGVSAPTAHALRLAESTGITLIGSARNGAADLFSHPDRLTLAVAQSA